MSKKYVTYKGYRNEILSETRSIIFSVADESGNKPNLAGAIVVDLPKDAPVRITARYIQTLLELEAKAQEIDSSTIAFANVIVDRYQRYELTSVMQTRSGKVTTSKLYAMKDNKFVLANTTITDDMY